MTGSALWKKKLPPPPAPRIVAPSVGSADPVPITWLTNTTTRGLPFHGPRGVVEFPLATCPLHPFTVFDTWHSLNATRLSHRIMHRGPESYVKLFEELIEIGKRTGSYINIYMDPLDVKHIPGFGRMLEVLSDPELLVTTYTDYLDDGLPIVRSEAA